jgi:hypothetical protein
LETTHPPLPCISRPGAAFPPTPNRRGPAPTATGATRCLPAVIWAGGGHRDRGRDRLARRNALTLDALDALETAVVAADAPVVCLRGTGSAFCAGADLDAVAGEVAASDPAALHAVKTRLRDDADRETRERRERAAFGDLWEGFAR